MSCVDVDVPALDVDVLAMDVSPSLVGLPGTSLLFHSPLSYQMQKHHLGAYHEKSFVLMFQ